MVEIDWKTKSFILRGRVRSAVLMALHKPKTATVLAKELDTARSTVSSILLLLEKRGLAECLDPEASYNRYYQRTEMGNELAKEVSEILD